MLHASHCREPYFVDFWQDTTFSGGFSPQLIGYLSELWHTGEITIVIVWFRSDGKLVFRLIGRLRS